MLFIIIILLAAFIVTPLVDLCFNERVRIPVKITVYALVLAWFIYRLSVGRVM